MAVETAKEIAKRFSEMPDDELIVYTFWTKDDLEYPLSDLAPEAPTSDWWEEVSDTASDALEECIGQVNDAIYSFLEDAIANEEKDN